MNRFGYRILGLAGMAAVLVGGAFGVQGCDENGNPLDSDGGVIGNLAKECGLTCPEQGIVEGNASISGVARVDAFFGAVVDFDTAANTTASNIRARLDAIAISLGLEPGASGAEIRSALEARIAANVDGGLEIRYQEPKCAASADVVAHAQARCEGMVDPGEARVSCEGTCQAQANIQASCTAEGELECTVTEPKVECEGTCQGSCELMAAASCEGSCQGSCEGTCSVCAGGECETQGGVVTNCAGKCDGMCEGSCELAAGGTCEGRCEGQCTAELPSAECEAMANVECDAEASGSIQCEGSCDADFEPPSASAECEASAEASAKVNVECTPPRLDIAWQWAASVEGDAMAQAEFKGWLSSFRVQYAELVAELKRSDAVIDAGAQLVASAEGAVTTSAMAAAEGELSLKQQRGLLCAATELGRVSMIVDDATGNLEASVTAAGEVTAAIGG